MPSPRSSRRADGERSVSLQLQKLLPHFAPPQRVCLRWNIDVQWEDAQRLLGQEGATTDWRMLYQRRCGAWGARAWKRNHLMHAERRMHHRPRMGSLSTRQLSWNPCMLWLPSRG